jgi:hypothetical protein
LIWIFTPQIYFYIYSISSFLLVFFSSYEEWQFSEILKFNRSLFCRNSKQIPSFCRYPSYWKVKITHLTKCYSLGLILSVMFEIFVYLIQWFSHIIFYKFVTCPSDLFPRNLTSGLMILNSKIDIYSYKM